MENSKDGTLAWLSYLFIIVIIVMLGLIGRQLEDLTEKVDALSSSSQAIHCEKKGCSLP